MNEETRESYDSGEVVWVKLGSSWWPGEVKNAEELPSEVLDFKKPPLVIVKFFDEDSYEYVKTWTNIYPYNCDKKNEFIKKGMAAYRAKLPHMEKFPKDVLKAEEKVGGNPNILSNPMFLPEKKRNYAAEIFGTPSPKNSSSKSKKRSNTNKSSGKKDTSHITHRRFLGVDDYRAYICIQYPGKDRIPGDREDEEVIRINRELEQDFNCHSCSFSTKRLEVMILHTKSHIQGVYLSSARKNKQTVRRRKEKSKKSRGSNSDTSTSDSEPVRQKKRKPKSQGAKKTKIKKAEEEAPKKDIRSELLEAWEDSEDEDMDFGLDKMNESEPTEDKSNKLMDYSSIPQLTLDDSLKASDTLDKTAGPDQSETETADETSKPIRPLDEPRSPSQTIEEVLNDVSGELDEANAQNEPVKPVEEHLSTEKLLSTLEDDSTDVDDKASEKKDEEEVDKVDGEQENVKKDDEENAASQKSDTDEDTSKQTMNRDMHEAIKSCFDFDEDDEEDTIVGNATSGRKIPRVIPKVTRKKSSETADPEPIKETPKDKGEDMSAAFHELMEITSVPDLPDVQNTLKCEQNFHNIKTIKFPDKAEEAGSPPKPERKDSTEVATKLTNPKKRFVKSFEDFELMQNEIRRREEEQLETSKNEKYDSGFDFEEARTEFTGGSSKNYDSDNSDERDSPDSTIQLSKLKSKIMSKIIEEARINAVSKNKIMSKIKDAKPKPAETEVNPATAEPEAKSSVNSLEKTKTERVTSHRTPRSKILESYRKDASKHKVEQKSETPQSNNEDRLRDSQSVKEVVPPKKNKWSRRGSHPKKDRNLFVLQDAAPEDPVTTEIEKQTVDESTNNQTNVELELIDDARKINDIILGESSSTLSDILTPSDDVPTSRDDVPTPRDDVPTPPDDVSIPHDDVPTPCDDVSIQYEDVSTPRDDVLTPSDDVPISRDDVPQPRDDVPQPHDDVPQSGDDVPQPRDDVPLPRDDVPPKGDDVPQPRDDVSQKDDDVSQKDDDVPQKGDDVPQPRDDVPQPHEVLEVAETTAKEAESTEPQLTELLPLQVDENDTASKKDEIIEESQMLVNEEVEVVDILPSAYTEATEVKETPQETPQETEFSVETNEVRREEVVEEATLEEVPQKMELGAVQEENERVIEEVTDLHPQDASSVVEESPVTDDPSANIEETSVVPSTESETVASNKVGPEAVPITEEHIEVEDSLVISPINEAEASLPQDAIVTPPKKSKKRKISEGGVPLSPTKSGTVAEPQPEDFAPLEKKLKEGEYAEEEVKVTSPALETFDKVGSEVDVENEEVKDEGQGGKVEIMETEPAAVETDKSVKEKKNTGEFERYDEEIKMESELVVDIAETDVIGKEIEEKAGKSTEPDAAREKPEDVDSNEDLDKDKDHHNEVEIQCASSSVESFKFSIQTNLSILSSREEMSALALATLSEIKADLESNEDLMPKEKEAKPSPPVLPESEMVPIEGNLTVVSEKDLADGQVEITSEQVISPKRPATLSNFSMDFSDSLSDSNSNSTTDTSCDLGKADFNSKGTEFTAKALTKQMKRFDQKKESTYGRLELINILEGNSDTEKKPKEFTHPPKKTTMVDDICDFEEHIPSQIVCAKNLKKDVPAEFEQDYKEFREKEKTSKTSVKSTTSKLLERLTTESKAKASAAKSMIASVHPVPELLSKLPVKAQAVPPSKTTKYSSKSKLGVGKPIILSEQIVKPATDTSKLKLRKPMEDFENVEAFVIHKDPSKSNLEEEETKSKVTSAKAPGKAKILQQTIITPAGEIIQPNVTEAQPDDNIFDINSMPIVLSDEILTPESIEKMPIVIGSDAKVTVAEKAPKRPAPSRIVTTVTSQVATNKTVTITKHKPPRILQTFSGKVAKNSPLHPNTAKPGKYIIVPQSSIPPTKYLSKKPTIVKKAPVPTGLVQKVPNIAPEPSGNKIMIVTNQQGQQQRLLLTPAQQKMLGYQNQKVTKTIVKSNVMQKSILASKGVSVAEASTSGVVSKTPTIIGQKVLVGPNTAQGLITTTGQQVIGIQGRTAKTVTKRTTAAAPKLGAPAGKPQKTILIKNQHGQTVRKIQGTDDELLDKQVAEQLKAIKASSGMKFSSQQKAVDIEKTAPKGTLRRSYSKRVEVKPRGPPPLTGIHHSPKQETVVSVSTTAAKKTEASEAKAASSLLSEETKAQQTERPLNQLVIQDAVGNQTTITEGQILALPSETVDGQPQSYMLVTLDESGNLTPLNSEALMSLDPNLGLGGDLSNMVLQFDQSGSSEQPQAAIIKPPELPEPVKSVEVEPAPQPVPVTVPEPSVTTEISDTAEQKIVPTTEQVAASTNGDSGQQLIVTGDPIATQKFLESLTEGTTDLANILANAEGNSILIQADGQQILINTNTDNQMLLSMNNDSANVTENTEGGGNPIFATQPSKNQDILAAALADTDVFQQEHPSSTQSKIVSQLSPTNALYPMNVGNVLETSLTLSSPIMTPLEVPSTNNKKIPDDEADILTQVPKNVDLPITITDPNISQTVANQQVSQMIANELQTNLDLALPISETTISAVSTDVNSPSYVYSLPTLDDSVEMSQKPFNGSMPLLTEDVVEETAGKKTEEEQKEDPPKDKDKESEGFLGEEEGRFTLGGEMCSSLSEPPPEMFDLPEVSQNFTGKGGADVPSLQSTPDASDNASKDEDTTDLSQADTSSEGSCEIPLQPRIVTKSLDLSRDLDSLKRGLGDAGDGKNKKCKFD
ncbi:titin [Anoplophora glabripennis]|nr:titin [Anoplophora glabripennis]